MKHIEYSPLEMNGLSGDQLDYAIAQTEAEGIAAIVELYPFTKKQIREVEKVHKNAAGRLSYLERLRQELREEIKVLESKLAREEENQESLFLQITALDQRNRELESDVVDFIEEERRLEKENNWLFWAGIATAGVILFTPDIADLIRMIIAFNN